MQSTLTLFSILSCGTSVANQDEDSMSLLQLSAAPRDTRNIDWRLGLVPCHASTRKLRADAIDTTMKDRDLKICRSWGDVHPSQMFFDKIFDTSKHGESTPYQFAQRGVSRVAAACDGSWEIQQFQFPCGSLGCQQGAAIKIGSMRFEIYNPSGVANDVKCFMGNGGQTPCTESGSHGGVSWTWSRTSAFCLEYANQVALTVHLFDKGYYWDQIIHVPKSVCTTKSDNMCGGEEHLVNGESCNDPGVNCRPKPGDIYTMMQGNTVTSEQQLFSETALNILCKRGGHHSSDRMTLDMCNFPEEMPGSPEEICQKNGNEMSAVEAVCAPLKEKHPAFYSDCIVDECAQLNPEEEKVIEVIAEVTEEENECLKEPCNDICDAVSLNLDKVHSNLGGKGPDSGAAEMRFSDVAIINGMKTDLVIVSTSEYNPLKPENNAASGGIGVINLNGGESVSLTFSLVKTGTNEEINLDTPFVLSFVDVDKGKRGNVESLTVCGDVNIHKREVSAIATESNGDCHQITAAQKGTKKDNPTSLDLTEDQKTRSFDIEVSKSSFTVQMEIKEKKGKMSARNFMFGGQSVVGHCD